VAGRQGAFPRRSAVIVTAGAKLREGAPGRVWSRSAYPIAGSDPTDSTRGRATRSPGTRVDPDVRLQTRATRHVSGDAAPIGCAGPGSTHRQLQDEASTRSSSASTGQLANVLGGTGKARTGVGASPSDGGEGLRAAPTHFPGGVSGSHLEAASSPPPAAGIAPPPTTFGVGPALIIARGRAPPGSPGRATACLLPAARR
jgi:hypothetical protein